MLSVSSSVCQQKRTGPGPDYETGESHIPEEEITFIAQQAPKAKYVMSVCLGAFQLALAGVLKGKRATTNKLFYRTIVVCTKFNIPNPKADSVSVLRLRRQKRLSGSLRRDGS
jgi:hypothetical protein